MPRTRAVVHRRRTAPKQLPRGLGGATWAAGRSEGLKTESGGVSGPPPASQPMSQNRGETSIRSEHSRSGSPLFGAAPTLWECVRPIGAPAA